eukprot:1207036-Rhodomonas_salina.1
MIHSCGAGVLVVRLDSALNRSHAGMLMCGDVTSCCCRLAVSTCECVLSPCSPAHLPPSLSVWKSPGRALVPTP